MPKHSLQFHQEGANCLWSSPRRGPRGMGVGCRGDEAAAARRTRRPRGLPLPGRWGGLLLLLVCVVGSAFDAGPALLFPVDSGLLWGGVWTTCVRGRLDL